MDTRTEEVRQNMGSKHSYSGWQQAWPDLIVHTQTDTAVGYLQRYYAAQDGQPAYTGSRFESMAALNSDPNGLGPEDFVAVSMLSVSVPAQAAIRLLGPRRRGRREHLHCRQHCRQWRRRGDGRQRR